MRKFTIGVGMLLAAAVPCARGAGPVTPEDLAEKDAWVKSHFQEARPEGGLPFSFTYDGRASAEFLAAWGRTQEEQKLDDNRTRRTTAWTDPKTGLQVRCEAVDYHDFPTVEWTLYFRNTGAKDTPIVEDIQALDVRFSRPAEGEFLLHHQAGSQANSDDYRPFQTPLKPKSDLRLAPAGGRGSDGVWPYFNIEWPGEDVIAVIGWPGQWAATFTRDEGRGLHLRAGQERTHFKLLPGEEVRSPLVVLQFRHGDWIGAQNVWRRWMLAHNVPRLGGRLPSPMLAASSFAFFSEMQRATQQNQKEFIDDYLRQDIQLTFWWMDAGWYVFKNGWPDVGTWEVDRKRFPDGLRAVSDHAHEKGVKTLLWFEPERVTPGTWFYDHHQDWLIGPDGGQKLLDLGNPEARQWVIEHTDQVMREQGIDIYRQDCNFNLLGYWRGHDAPDRQGITEIKHVTGYLAFWDELRRRHPDLLIDTCASGGRRNDLETLRRAVPLHKSDMDYPNLTAKQTQLYGLALWEPYFGAAVFPLERVDVYGFRSAIAPQTGLSYDVRRKDLDYALLRTLIAQRKEMVANLYGDYYPLTPWSFDQDVWLAYQFDRPEVGQGLVQAFRRPKSVSESARFKLHGLDPEATYVVRDFDAEGVSEARGRDLMEKGLAITLKEKPGAALITYRRKE